MHREPNGPLGDYEAISISLRTTRVVKTRHHTLASAQARLLGNRRHKDMRLLIHTVFNCVPATARVELPYGL